MHGFWKRDGHTRLPAGDEEPIITPGNTAGMPTTLLDIRFYLRIRTQAIQRIVKRTASNSTATATRGRQDISGTDILGFEGNRRPRDLSSAFARAIEMFSVSFFAVWCEKTL